MMKRKTNLVPMISPEIDAQHKFATQVQSIAFQLTLSRRMIDLLRVCRDYGFPEMTRSREIPAEWDAWKQARSVTRIENGSEQFVKFIDALIRRGLVIHDARGRNEIKPGEKRFYLSRAGELTCEILVLCGLMAAPAQETKKARKA